MPSPITVPRLGWSMEEATFSAWLKKPGDMVNAGEPLFTLESDKATQDIESLDAGRLHLAPDAPVAGETVKVGQLIGYLLQPGETADSPAAPSIGISDKAPSIPAPAPIAAATPATASPPVAQTAPRISPRALRVATEHGVDWRTLKGTGRTGRIRERDIRAAMAPPGAAANPRPGLSATRRTIADRMVASLRESAPVTLHTTVDATRMVSWRGILKSAATSSDNPPSLTDILLHKTAEALKQHPALNARWENGDIVASREVHLGLAVDTEHGLIVPVIRDAGSLSLGQLCSRARDLANRARTRKLRPEELRGGTFTVTNLGAFGIDAFTPIINPPECAILGIGRIQRRPAVMNDQIVPRDLLTLSLTIDHRAIDGAPAARFLQTLTQLIETAS